MISGDDQNNYSYEKTDSAEAVCNTTQPAPHSFAFSSISRLQTSKTNLNTNQKANLNTCADNLWSWVDLLYRLGSFQKLIIIINDGIKLLLKYLDSAGAKLIILEDEKITTITEIGDIALNISVEELASQQNRLSRFLVFPIGKENNQQWFLIFKNPHKADAEILHADFLGFFRCALKAYINLYHRYNQFEKDNRILLSPKHVRIQNIFPTIITQNSEVLEILSLVKTFAKTDLPILIQGESGTGKELIAQAIHNKSNRKGKPFITENCAAIPDSLLESEFFGVKKGAFTGADSNRPGLFRLADGGSLFLDEIGEMSFNLQKKLLRVIQEKELRSVGGNKPEKINVRLIAATNRRLDNMVESKVFRKDLFFRLNAVTLNLPPLRERKEDIPLLTKYFIDKYNKKQDNNRCRLIFSADAIQLFLQYNWPGNIRELKNEITKSAVLAEEGIIYPCNISRHIRPDNNESTPQELMKGSIDLLDFERKTIGGVIQKILCSVNGNKAACAKVLGIPKTSLYRRMNKLGLK